ncbi:MAG: superinfection immunity protein [Alphaproteobacteria bacterium]|nr:superinfection immunity protein [Alphaproteobacteria bacterium]
MRWNKTPLGIKILIGWCIFGLIVFISENHEESIVTFLFITGLYFAPYIVATQRCLKDASSIGVINLFLGWTLIGWVLSLAKAVSGTAEVEDSTP